MNIHPQDASPRRSEETAENAGLRESWWRQVRGPCATGRSERLRRAADQQLARRVEDIIVGLGLTQTNFSASGGDTLHVPQVVSVSAGLLKRLDVSLLPGQTVDDFVVHAPTIAHELGMTEVRIVARGPSLIRFEMVP
jgi:hypothetical protein